MNYIGIDPGKSGAIAVTDNDGAVEWIKCSETLHDICDFLWEYSSWHSCRAVLEKVHSMPQQGVKSTFSLGQSFGALEMALAAHKIPYVLVTPRTWMKYMNCATGGDKNVTKQEAQRRHPDIKVTHAVADALLLMDYCRLTQGVPHGT